MAKQTEIRAPMAGKVVSIEINIGDKVDEDDELVILESLKMETPVYSPGTGTVADIKVKNGDYIEEDDLLLVLE